MALTGDVTVIELDGPSLTALWARVSADAVVVNRWVSAVRPEEVAADRPEQVGAWLGKALRDADLPRRRVVMAVSRGDVILKQLVLPVAEGGGGLSDAELASIVGLQMSRQVTVSPAGAAIDYVRMDPRAVSEEGGAGAGVRVMAAAMPADRVAWARSVAEEAGLTLKRIGVESYGVAALLGELSLRRDGPVLGVAIGPQSTEFVIVDHGEMAFARAVGAMRPVVDGGGGTTADASSEAMEVFADRMSVEARRTLNSFRSQRSLDAACVAVLGQGELASRVASKCATALGVPFELVPFPGYVAVPADVPDAARCAIAPLVGLLVESVVGRPTLDFANPRKQPDTRAKSRQRVLAGVLAAIVLAGAGYVAADRQLASMRKQVDALRKSEAALKQERDRLLIDHARVNHFERWAGASPAGRMDWVGLTREVVEQLPESNQGQLDELAGRGEVEPTFVPNGGYPGGKWGVRAEGGIQIGGKVENRQVAEDLRERLLKSGLYQVENRGPDLEDRFALLLRVSRTGPGVESDGAKKPAGSPSGAVNAAKTAKEGGKP